eukprot:3648791-Rhodomonas_salina.1
MGCWDMTCAVEVAVQMLRALKVPPPVWSYAFAMPCPVCPTHLLLTSVLDFSMVLFSRYAMSGTDLCDAATRLYTLKACCIGMCLRARYAMPRTERVYDATRDVKPSNLFVTKVACLMSETGIVSYGLDTLSRAQGHDEHGECAVVKLGEGRKGGK